MLCYLRLKKFYRLQLFSCRRRNSQFKSTVHLPETAFPLNVKNKANHEKELQQICQFQNLYMWQWEAHIENDTFILHDGPPYANGDVHVGHALNKILKDITVRYKLLQGYRIHFKPGWDCHGLPIEIKAIKQRNFESLEPNEVRRRARDFAKASIARQKNAFQRWGVLADWKNEDGCYFTFNKSYQSIQLKAFYEMYKKNLIYRDMKPVFWSPSSRTALAESELEYNQKHTSRSVYVAFPIVSSISFSQFSEDISVLVWTTQPWTLPANQALCYNPSVKYCFVQFREKPPESTTPENRLYLLAVDTIPQVSRELNIECEVIDTFEADVLEGIQCAHPMDFSRVAPLLPAPHATTEMGTGVVHTAPAHGVDDFQLAQQHSLPTESNVNDAGCFLEEAEFGLEGKFIFREGNEAVIDMLKRKKTLVHSHDYIHSYPYDWRTKEPIFIKTSRQWFIDTSQLKEQALNSISDVKVFPSSGGESLASILKMRPYWCISRQRVWGVPIPVFYHRKSGDIFLNNATITHLQLLFQKYGSDVWFTLPVDELLPQSVLQESGYDGSSSDFETGSDILDIWFDSGISWAAVLGDGFNIPSTIASMYVEGKDQYNGWFQSSLLTSVGLRNCAPYQQLMVHGFAVAEDGQKMSKSLGNVVDPMVLVDGGKNPAAEPSYGADALRWWVAQSNVFAEVQISRKLINDASISVQKIRASLRFLVSNLKGFSEKNRILDAQYMPALDQYFIYLLTEYVRQVTDSYNDYKYSNVCRTTLNFVTKLSNLYFSCVKDRMYCDTKRGMRRKSGQTTIYIILEAIMKTIAPILPHLAEEVMVHHPCPRASSAFKDGWFYVDSLSSAYDTSVVDAVECAIHLRAELMSIVGATKQNQPTSYDIIVSVSEEPALSLLKKLQQESVSYESDLCEILSCSKCTLTQHTSGDETASEELVKVLKVPVKATPAEIVLSAQLSDAFKCPRCRKNTSEANGRLCQRCTDALSDGWDT